jgi:hypothetical protein
LKSTEFLGKHQFTWVREADILENFDPQQDPNAPTAMHPGLDATSGGKKHRKHVSHSVADTPAYNTAVQECQWAVEEFEMQVRDPCGDLYSMEDDDEGEDDEEAEEAGLPKYSFSILAQPSTDQESHRDHAAEETDDEGEALYATQGFIDVTVEGRKRFMALSSSAKRQREAASRREKAEQVKREKAAVAKSKKPKQSGASGTASSSSTKKAAASTITPIATVVETEVSTSIKKRKVSGDAEKHDQQSSRKRPTLEKAHSGSAAGKGFKKRSNVIPDKKSRARAKVRAYITKLIQKGLVIPTAAHTSTGGSGASGGGGSHTIDTSGLMGMALAFRAAAGEIPGVDPRDEYDVRPWDFIDIPASKAPQERCRLMKRKIELLQKAFYSLETENRRREQILDTFQRKKRKGGSLNAAIDKPYDSNGLETVISGKKSSAVVTENGNFNHRASVIPQQAKDSLQNVSDVTTKENISMQLEESTNSESDAETEDEDSHDIQW